MTVFECTHFLRSFFSSFQLKGNQNVTETKLRCAWSNVRLSDGKQTGLGDLRLTALFYHFFFCSLSHPHSLTLALSLCSLSLYSFPSLLPGLLNATFPSKARSSRLKTRKAILNWLSRALLTTHQRNRSSVLSMKKRYARERLGWTCIFHVASLRRCTF